MPPETLDPRSDGPERLDLFWIGDPGEARLALARRAPHITITASDLASAAGALASGSVRADVLVIDTTLGEREVQEFLSRLEPRHIDLPIVLLTRPGGQDLLAQMVDLATFERVVKTPDFVLQLQPALSQARARRELLAQLRASRQGQDRLRGILEHQPAASCVFGRDGTVSAMNQAGLVMLGATREQVVGRPVTDFIATDDWPAVAALLRRVYEGLPDEIALTLERADGRTVPARLRTVPYRHDDRLVALSSLEARSQADIAAPPVTAGRDFAVVAPPAVMAERNRLTAALRDATAEVEALRAERAQWTATHARLEAEIRESSEQSAAALRQATADVEALRAERAEWTTARGRLEAQLRETADQSAAALHHVTGDAEALRAEQAHLAEERAAIEGELRGVHAELVAERAEWNATRARLEAERRRVEEESAAELRQARADLERVRDELARVRVLAERERDVRQPSAASAAPVHLETLNLEPPSESDEPVQPERRTPVQIERAEARIRQLEDERDQLTHVLHGVAGRCEAAEADLRRLRTAVGEAEERHRADAATIEQLQAEHDFSSMLSEQRRSRIEQLETMLAQERTTWSEESEAARYSNRLLTAALEAEQQRTDRLENRLAAARALIEEWAALRHSLASDHQTVLGLRDILGVLAETDRQFKALLEHQEAVLRRCAELQPRERS